MNYILYAKSLMELIVLPYEFTGWKDDGINYKLQYKKMLTEDASKNVQCYLSQTKRQQIAATLRTMVSSRCNRMEAKAAPFRVHENTVVVRCEQRRAVEILQGHKFCARYQCEMGEQIFECDSGLDGSFRVSEEKWPSKTIENCTFEH